MILFEEDFDDKLLGLEAVKAERAKEVALSEGYAKAGIVVEACEPVENGERGGGWSTSAARALTIRGQLIDAGVEPGRISARLLGPACAVIAPDGAGRMALARLSFEKVRTDG